MSIKKTETIEMKPIKVKRFQVKVVGDTPLIVHAWDEKSKRMMLEAQQGKKKGTKKEYKNPVADFINSMYWIEGKPEMDPSWKEEECEKAFVDAVNNGARFGFRADAFKKASVNAAYRGGYSKDKVSINGAFFVNADYGDLVEITSDVPIMREDMVRIGMGTADIRYRAEFRNWSAVLTIIWNENGSYPIERIVEFLNQGGFACGIGEWRPEKSGQYGMYHVELTK